MPNPAFMPVIGSGFSDVADQQRQWAGFNNQVDRANLDSFQRATDARNNYFQTVAEMRRADAQRQQAEQAAADADAVRQYQFNVNTQLDKNQQDIERQKIAAQTAAKDYADQRKQALADAKDNESAADALAGEGHFNTKAELDAALPSSTPLVRAALWDKNTQARQQLEQQFNFQGGIAKKENLKTGLNDLAGSLPASKDAKPAYPNEGFLSQLLGGWFGTKNPDMSWYDARKSAIGAEAANLGRDLAPVEKQGLEQNGIVLDPATGKYKPASTPAWLQKPQTQPRPLDRATAAAYLTRANGDKNKARQMAQADGYTF